MTDLERLMVEDRRYIAAENYEDGKRHGIQRGLGMAADIAHGCLDEVEKLGKSSHGYRLAILDITHRILERLKESDNG